MDEIKLLILEDNTKQQLAYKDSIELFNKDSELKICFDIKGDYDNCVILIGSKEYDAAIIDIKLGGTDTIGKGNDLIRLIKNKLRYPIFVITGYPGDIDPELSNENMFFKIYERDKITHIDLFKEIENLYKTGFTKILGGRGIIDKYLTEIFWNNLADSLNIWFGIENSEKTLLRYILTNLFVYLDSDESGAFEKYQAIEVYIKPNLPSRIFTCDLLIKKDDKKNFIVLTPICDLAQNKAKCVTLAEVEPFTSGIINEKKNIIKKDSNGEKKKEAEDILKKIFNNNYSNKYYFLPYSEIYPGGLVNFQKLSSCKLESIEDEFEISAKIAHQFVKDIIAKFSNYYSRQGSPDFYEEQIYRDIIK